MSGYTTRRGSEAPNAKMTGLREEVKERRARGETYREIAHDLRVDPKTIWKLDHGISYADEE